MGVKLEATLSDQSEICTSYIKDLIASGTDWHIALFKAIGMWTAPSESWRGCTYTYVISGEFSWYIDPITDQLKYKKKINERFIGLDVVGDVMITNAIQSPTQ